jgi:hypothetical protein
VTRDLDGLLAVAVEEAEQAVEMLRNAFSAASYLRV